VLSVLEANDLLEEAEALRVKNRFDELRDLLASVPNRLFDSEGSLRYYSGVVALRSGNYINALANVQRAIEILPAFENTRVHRRCLNLQGIILIELGRLDAAEECLLDASSAAAAAEDLEILANTTMNLGVIADMRCRWEQAIAAFTRARFVFESIAKHRMAAGSHHNLGMSLRQLGLFSDAYAHYDHALEGYTAFGTNADLVGIYSERALLLSDMGDGKQAERCAKRALSIARELGHARFIGECLRSLGAVLLRNGQRSDGRQSLELALPISQETHMTMLEAELHEELAVLERREGNEHSGERHLESCVNLYTKIGADMRSERAKMRYYTGSTEDSTNGLGE
jgi:tetratricopeptide (TPR) repeat protein